MWLAALAVKVDVSARGELQPALEKVEQRKEVEIVNKLGSHARPASHLVRCVIRFKSKITICKGDENFSAASILEVLSADLDCGARVVLEAIGPDEQGT